MAGTKKSGNPWQFHVNPDAPIGVFISSLASNENQGISTWVLNQILRTHLKEAEDFFKENPELLQIYREKYSKTIIQQTLERQKSNEEQEAKREREIRIRERELLIKLGNAENFKQQTQISVEKAKSEETEALWENFDRLTQYPELKDHPRLNTIAKDNAEKASAMLEKLKALGAPTEREETWLKNLKQV